jgi:hypothetical protein
VALATVTVLASACAEPYADGAAAASAAEQGARSGVPDDPGGESGVAGAAEATPSLEEVLGALFGGAPAAQGDDKAQQSVDREPEPRTDDVADRIEPVGASPSWTPPPGRRDEPSQNSAPTPEPPAEVESPTAKPSATVPPTPTEDPFRAAGRPVRFYAPAIGVDASVESVGLTNDGRMDVPRQWMNVGWYSGGYFPGETGNAVVAGHLDSNTGGPAVFWDLDKLQPGDEVAVTYENGDLYTFRVTGSETYPYDAQGSMVESIFGPSLTTDLNMITCDGAWQHGQATYSHRLVVFATLDPTKTVLASLGGSSAD